MSTKEDVQAAREAKKVAKQNAKLKNPKADLPTAEPSTPQKGPLQPSAQTSQQIVKETESPKSKDEVDRASEIETEIQSMEKTKGDIQAERAAKKLAKQAKKKLPHVSSGNTVEKEITNKAVAETLKNIVEVAKEVQQVTAKVNTLMLKVKPSLLVKVTRAGQKLCYLYFKQRVGKLDPFIPS